MSILVYEHLSSEAVYIASSLLVTRSWVDVGFGVRLGQKKGDAPHARQAQGPPKWQRQQARDASAPRAMMASSIPIPPALKRLFDAFPLRAYPPNALPARCRPPTSSSPPRPLLHIYTTPQAAAAGLPSGDPLCLQWQVTALLLLHYLNIIAMCIYTIPYRSQLTGEKMNIDILATLRN